MCNYSSNLLTEILLSSPLAFMQQVLPLKKNYKITISIPQANNKIAPKFNYT